MDRVALFHYKISLPECFQHLELISFDKEFGEYASYFKTKKGPNRWFICFEARREKDFLNHLLLEKLKGNHAKIRVEDDLEYVNFITKGLRTLRTQKSSEGLTKIKKLEEELEQIEKEITRLRVEINLLYNKKSTIYTKVSRINEEEERKILQKMAKIVAGKKDLKRQHRIRLSSS